jgi:acetyl esterase
MLHPEVRALLDLIERRGLPPTHTLGVAEARNLYRDRRHFTQPPPAEVGSVRDLQATGPAGAIALRLYRPQGSPDDLPLAALVYFHGGGWVIGDLDTHDSVCRQLTNLSGCALVAVDYRLAPEHPFPAAVNDAIAATRWVRAHAFDLGIDPERLGVGGDSAGGNLAAVVAIDARDQSDLPLRFQMLIYPATEQHCRLPSHAENGQGYLLTRETMEYFAGHYLREAAHYDDWRASPLLHPDLSRLPPALVVTAGFDPLRDEGAAYAARLAAAGNLATHVSFPGQIHGFVTMGKVLSEAQTAVALCAAELRRALA